MLANVMDFDPRITSDGSGYGAEHGWGCNFSFGYGYDIIDEDTETEKCRVQALQFLIAKADTEILDLEDELAILQCQLKWAESCKQMDPYEASCTAFKRKIESLTSSIQCSSGGNVLSRHAMDETLNIQRPAERVYTIINALMTNKFSVPGEQVVLNRMNLLADLGSPNTDIDLIQHAAGFESSMESEEPTSVMEKKPAHTISEESSSDAARYTSKDLKEGRDVNTSDAKVSGIGRIDVDKCTSEERCKSLKPIMISTHLQTSREGNPNSDVLRHGESQECLIRSTIGKSGSTSLPAKVQLIVKLEEDYDMNIQHVAVDSLPKMMTDHEIDDPAEDQLKEIENHSQNLVNTHLTYNRRKLNLSPLLTQQGQKVQRKTQLDLKAVEPSTPSLTLKPLRKIDKRKSPSIAKSFGQLGTPSKVEGMILIPNPKSNWPSKSRIDEDVGYANASGVLGAKRRKIQGDSGESDIFQSLEGEAYDAKSLNGRQISLGEVDGSIVTFDSANVHSVTVLEDPMNGLENLRIKLSEDPSFLNKLKLSELKAIMKQNKLRGSYKLKKEKIVEELTKQLCL